MKICPTCNRAYADETLSYCLDDGSLLSRPYEPEPTQFLPLSRATTPAKTEIIPHTPPDIEREKRGDNSAFRYIVIALLALIAGGGIMAWLTLRTKEAAPVDNAVVKSSPQATPASSPGAATPQPTPTSPTSVEITATASSAHSPESGISYQPDNVLDQSIATAWIEGVSGPGVGEWIRFDFTREVKLNRIIITPGYFKTPELWEQNNRLAAATFYFSDGSSRRFNFPDRLVEQRLEVGGVKTSWVRMVIDDYYPGSVDEEDTPVSSLAFDWK
jgi:cell division septation protein DedD